MNKKIRALLVDDEEHGRIVLRYALAAYPDWQLVGECNSVASAREFLTSAAVDVIFLDIHMPKESGLSLARSLCVESAPPLIIFVTAYNVHAVDAFELHALDYLLKPFNPQRFAQALDRASEMLALRPRDGYSLALRAYVAAEDKLLRGDSAHYLQQVVVRSVGVMECIRLNEVFWISAAGNYVELHLAARTVLHRIPLSKLEEHLDPRVFIRVHRSAIVRADQFLRLLIARDGSYLLMLACGDEIIVSERYVAIVRERLQLSSLNGAI